MIVFKIVFIDVQNMYIDTYIWYYISYDVVLFAGVLSDLILRFGKFTLGLIHILRAPSAWCWQTWYTKENAFCFLLFRKQRDNEAEFFQFHLPSWMVWTVNQSIISRWWFQILLFLPSARWSSLTSIFQEGWNHQLDTFGSFKQCMIGKAPTRWAPMIVINEVKKWVTHWGEISPYL